MIEQKIEQKKEAQYTTAGVLAQDQVWDAAHALLQAGTMDNLCRQAVSVARRYLNVNQCSIYLLDEAGTQLRGMYGIDQDGRLIDERASVVDLSDAEREAWAALTAIRDRSGRLIGVFFNNALVATNGVAGAQRDPAKQSLITTYCDVIDSVAESILRETALRQSRDALMLQLSQQRSETEKSKQAALVAIDEATRDAVKSERSRIARELHHSVSQSFFSIVLGVHTAIEYTQRDPSKVIDPLNYVLHMAEDGLEETRALIFELRPESLTQEGLRAALRQQATALTVRPKIDIVTALGDT